jgi:hypothetical protein
LVDVGLGYVQLGQSIKYVIRWRGAAYQAGIVPGEGQQYTQNAVSFLMSQPPACILPILKNC